MEGWPTISEDVVHRRVDDEVVLVHLRTNQIFALNDTGARFWELFAEGLDRATIESTMLAEFDVEPDELGQEIDALLDELAAEGLVGVA